MVKIIIQSKSCDFHRKIVITYEQPFSRHMTIVPFLLAATVYINIYIYIYIERYILEVEMKIIKIKTSNSS